jgi:hypothetical protein
MFWGVGLKQQKKKSSPEGKRKERGLISNHCIEGAVINKYYFNLSKKTCLSRGFFAYVKISRPMR